MNNLFFKESIIATLVVFRWGKRRYIVGILALEPARYSIWFSYGYGAGHWCYYYRENWTTRSAFESCIGFWQALGMYYLRYVWWMYILATSYRLGQIMRSRSFEHFTKMSPSFTRDKYRTDSGRPMQLMISTPTFWLVGVLRFSRRCVYRQLL